MASSALEACDVGLEVAENAGEVLIELNRFTNNRIGARFAAGHSQLVGREEPVLRQQGRRPLGRSQHGETRAPP